MTKCKTCEYFTLNKESGEWDGCCCYYPPKFIVVRNSDGYDDISACSAPADKEGFCSKWKRKHVELTND